MSQITPKQWYDFHSYFIFQQHAYAYTQNHPRSATPDTHACVRTRTRIQQYYTCTHGHLAISHTHTHIYHTIHTHTNTQQYYTHTCTFSTSAYKHTHTCTPTCTFSNTTHSAKLHLCTCTHTYLVCLVEYDYCKMVGNPKLLMYYIYTALLKSSIRLYLNLHFSL